MSVFLAFINDRHVDPDAEVFATFEYAEAHLAKYLAHRNSAGQPIEVDTPPPDGWRFCASCGFEA